MAVGSYGDEGLVVVSIHVEVLGGPVLMCQVVIVVVIDEAAALAMVVVVMVLWWCTAVIADY